MRNLVFMAAAMAAFVAASCNAPVAPSAAPPVAASTEQVIGQAVHSVDSEPAQSAPEVAGIECSRGVCGCWHDAALSYRLQINDAQGAPVEGVEAICPGETEAMARSSGTGLLTFDLATQQSPGCGYRRCKTLMLVDPRGRYAPQQATAGVTGGNVVLEPNPR